MATFPTTWPQHRPLILGHRGASHAAPQNTLAAFHKAAAMGADGVELDVHLSADGVPVVIHDALVNATTDGSGAVADLSLAELQSLDAGVRFNPSFAGERIPTLEEVLAAVGQQLIINIELKAFARRDAALEKAVVTLVRRLGLVDRVWFSSFKPYALVRARSEAPEIPCGLLYDGLGLGAQLLRPITPHEALHPHHGLLSRARIQRAHKRGLWVATWTVDDVARAQTLAEWGVDAIITNEPERLLAALR
ncbi:MAG: glycerophosphodiester phosphodiesterase [Anaerolineae bacterium]|nr:glycerophosphodiester phosphodiesterase [Anaerolineae bacterium]